MVSPGEERPDEGGFRASPPAARPDDCAPRFGPTPYDPPGAHDLPYVYNPYGNVSYPSSYPVPAGSDAADARPVRRPGAVHGALALLLVATVPYLFSGLLAVLGAAEVAATAPETQLDQLRQLGVDPAQVVRIGGVLVVAVALVFALLAVLAWTGRAWARALLAAMTAGFVLLVVAVVVLQGRQAATDAGSLVVIVLPVVLAAAGVALLFGSAARAWFTRRR